MARPTTPAAGVVLACMRASEQSVGTNPASGRALVVVSALVPSDSVARLEIDIPRRIAIWTGPPGGSSDGPSAARPVRLHVRVIDDASFAPDATGRHDGERTRNHPARKRHGRWPAGCALTAREAEVLGWVGRGKTNRDVAALLGLSARTVQKHLEHVYQKLGVETRTAAVLAFGNPGAAPR